MAEAFLAGGLGPGAGNAFGTLPASAGTDALIARSVPA